MRVWNRLGERSEPARQSLGTGSAIARNRLGERFSPDSRQAGARESGRRVEGSRARNFSRAAFNSGDPGVLLGSNSSSVGELRRLPPTGRVAGGMTPARTRRQASGSRPQAWALTSAGLTPSADSARGPGTEWSANGCDPCHRDCDDEPDAQRCRQRKGYAQGGDASKHGSPRFGNPAN
jgi:hypothetical protein